MIGDGKIQEGGMQAHERLAAASTDLLTIIHNCRYSLGVFSCRHVPHVFQGEGRSGTDIRMGLLDGIRKSLDDMT